MVLSTYLSYKEWNWKKNKKEENEHQGEIYSVCCYCGLIETQIQDRTSSWDI